MRAGWAFVDALDLKPLDQRIRAVEGRRGTRGCSSVTAGRRRMTWSTAASRPRPTSRWSSNAAAARRRRFTAQIGCVARASIPARDVATTRMNRSPVVSGWRPRQLKDIDDARRSRNFRAAGDISLGNRDGIAEIGPDDVQDAVIEADVRRHQGLLLESLDGKTMAAASGTTPYGRHLRNSKVRSGLQNRADGAWRPCRSTTFVAVMWGW